MSERGLLTSRVALRDRTIVDVLDLSFSFVREASGPLLRLSLLVLPLPLFLTILIGETAGWGAGWLLALGLAGLASAPFTVLVSQFVFEERPSVKTALLRGLEAGPKLIVVRILLLLAFFAGALILLMPVIWVGTSCFFVSEAVLLERARIWEAFSRSSRLGGRAGGDALTGSLLIGMILVLLPMLTHQIGGIALEQVLSIAAPHGLWDEGGSFLAAIGFWLAVPYAAVVRFLLYINVRTRTEGWDIQTAFATIAAEAEEARA